MEVESSEWPAHSYKRDDYLLANTYISSRAFPSSLLDPSASTTPINPSHMDTKASANQDQPSESVPAHEVTPKSYPVLIPGLDTLNHKRNQAVTWVSVPSSEATQGESSERSVGLVLRSETGAGEQVFNNYGPKGKSGSRPPLKVTTDGISRQRRVDPRLWLLIAGKPGRHSRPETRNPGRHVDTCYTHRSVPSPVFCL